MDYNVKKLLEKYWEGESTLKEEDFLRSYFQQKDILPELEQYRNLFAYFGAQQSISMKGNIDPASVEEITIRKKSPKSKRFSLWKIAASVALLIGCFLFYNNINTKQQESIVWEDTYDNEAEALAKAKEVLLLVSRKMKKGTDKAVLSLGKVKVATGVLRE